MGDDSTKVPTDPIPRPTPTWVPDKTPAPAPERTTGQRYHDVASLDTGGMAEVRQVFDSSLDRTLAMKILSPNLLARPDAVRAFLAEARQTARLEHPGIVPVHEIGVLDDGRPFFTMKQIRGRTLQSLLRGKARPGSEAYPLRRLIDVFQRVCEAVGYAHAQGVVHRDLKPANVMVGSFGEVLVLDWGIASPAGAPLEGVGRVPGTPEYMAPELVAGVGAVDPHSDTWALGWILAEILGAPVRGEVPPDAPAELIALVHAATDPSSARRPADAGVFAREIAAWAEGARRRDRAEELVARAAAGVPAIRELRDRATAIRAEAQAALDELPSWEEIERKRPFWSAIDRAEELARDAALAEVERDRDLHAALREVPDHEEAHALLADGFLARHEDALARHDGTGAARYETLLRSHGRERHRAWLEGRATVTVLTDRPARVEAFRFEVADRRLVPVPYADLGVTPLRAVTLPHGSWLFRLHHDAGTVELPLDLPRLAHRDGIAPGEDEPRPLRLPRAHDLGPDDVLVPAGWTRVGGDPLAFGALPSRRLWVDDFVVRRFVVTEPEYLLFLEDLRDAGRAEEAERFAPYNEPALGGQLWPHGADGRFALEGRDPRLPACGVDWFGARAYARWFADRTSLPWRLPSDVEWEKAARGADGRYFPFGNHADAAFCCIAGSHRDRPAVAPVDDWPLDVSPYGVRGLGGNVRDWVDCRYERNGAPVVAGRMPALPDPRPDAMRIQRGGAWSFHEQHARAATRWWQDPLFRHTAASFRLARSWSP